MNQAQKYCQTWTTIDQTKQAMSFTYGKQDVKTLKRLYAIQAQTTFFCFLVIIAKIVKK